MRSEDGMHQEVPFAWHVYEFRVPDVTEAYFHLFIADSSAYLYPLVLFADILPQYNILLEKTWTCYIITKMRWRVYWQKWLFYLLQVENFVLNFSAFMHRRHAILELAQCKNIGTTSIALGLREKPPNFRAFQKFHIHKTEY